MKSSEYEIMIINILREIQLFIYAINYKIYTIFDIVSFYHEIRFLFLYTTLFFRAGYLFF